VKELDLFLGEVRAAVDAELAQQLADRPGEDDPGRLREAMRYAVLGGGKRLRPAVVLGAAAAVGGDPIAALPAAAAVELLHAYSLVHDDLPAMDDDDERRGKPTVHVAFGEATAILVGDALLTEAFAALATLGSADAVRVLAERAGARGLIAGQARDLAETRPVSLAEVERIHAGKTGALFAACAELGAIAGGASGEVRVLMARYGMALGVLFQHADDVADGDHPGFAAEARRRMNELLDEARMVLAPLGERGRMLELLVRQVHSSGGTQLPSST
jgi:geranylgeranyl pyrophosphate synthase